jgi:hypothetical protein
MTRIRAIICAALLALSGTAWACPKCRPLVRAGIHDAHFTANLGLVLLPLALLATFGAALYFWDEWAHWAQRALKATQTTRWKMTRIGRSAAR